MSSRRSGPPSEQAAVSSGGGCLSGYIIPPLAVVCVGVLMAFFLLGSSPTGAVSAVPVETSGETIPAPADGETASLSPVFTSEIQYWAGRIASWSAETGLDPNLVATVMQIESCGDPRAHSRAGAMGLFQVMPYHFAGGDAPYDPDTNAQRGLAYLQRSLQASGGDTRLALAGYNGGIGVIGRAELGWAQETQRYAYWGSGIYEEASSGATESNRLQEWLGVGGASLCRQASQRLGINP